MNHLSAQSGVLVRCVRYALNSVLLFCFVSITPAYADPDRWGVSFAGFDPNNAVPSCTLCHDKIAAGPGKLILPNKDDVARNATFVIIEAPVADGARSSWRYRDPVSSADVYLPRFNDPEPSGPLQSQNAMIDFPIGTESMTIDYCAGQREPVNAAAAIFRCGEFRISRVPPPNQAPVITQPSSTLSLELQETKTENINVKVTDDNANDLDYQWTWNNGDAEVTPSSLVGRDGDQIFQFRGVSAGRTNFTLTVTDSSGATDTVSVSVTVVEQPENNGPTIASPVDGTAINFTNGVGRNLFVTVSDDSREIETFSVSNFDSDVVDVFETSPGFYIVSALANGSSTITFTVVDVDGLSAESTVCVSARDLPQTAASETSRPSTVCNDFPQLISVSPSINFLLEPGDVTSATLEILDDDPESHIRRLSVENPSVVQVDDGAGDDISIQAVGLGTSEVVATIEDAAGQVLVVPLNVEVVNEVIPNTPPTITAHAPSGEVSLVEGESQVVSLTVADVENDPITLTANSNNPFVVEVSPSSASSLTLTAGMVGSATISVIASDPFASSASTYTFDVRVVAQNTAPIAFDDFYVFTFETPTQSLSVLDNDIDVDGDSLTIELPKSDTQLGGSVVESGGVVIYTPPGVFNSVDRFDYQARDDRGALSSVGFVEITPSDVDGDGVFDGLDNCVLLQNTTQLDSDSDGLGDVCDPTPMPDGDLLVLGSGAALVEAECLTCHETGVSGAPLFGDDAAWQARIDAAGGDISVLVSSVINGLGAMPAFGQRYTAAELNAAVLYLIGREVPPVTEVPDEDLDAIADAEDNCVFYSNSDQADANGNGVGDACETDINNDGVLDYSLSFQSRQGEGENVRHGGLIARGNGPASVSVRTRSGLTGLSYDWSNSHPRLLEVASITEEGATLQFSPDALEPAQRDAVVVVSGNGISARGRTRLMILNGAVGEGFTDADQDGYPASSDSDDSNPRRLLANPATPTNTLTAQSSQALAIGDVAAVSAALSGYNSASIQLSDDAFLTAAALRYNDVEPIAVGNLNSSTQNINLEIHELDGEVGSVVLRLPGNLPLNPQLRVYRPQLAQWESLSTADGDSLASAPLGAGACPIAASPNFQDALTAGFACVRLSVKDGGANDIDERRDGVVSLLLNIGSPIDPTVSIATETPDVIIAANSSGGGGGWALPLLAFVSLRFRRQKNTRF